MRLEDKALAIVGNELDGFRITPVTITGISESLRKLTINGETERKAVKMYHVETADGKELSISSDNIFNESDKEKAIEKRNMLNGIETEKTKQIEEKHINKAKKELAILKKKSNKKWSEETENEILDLLKEGHISIPTRHDIALREEPYRSDFWDWHRNYVADILERLLSI